MISSAVIELRQSKKELLDLLGQQAHTLLETVVSAARNTLVTNIILEENIEERLLNNANMIRDLYDKKELSNRFLTEFARRNNLYRINVFAPDGEKIFTSHPQIHPDSLPDYEPEEVLMPIFNGEVDTLLLGLKASRYGRGFRYAVALAGPGRAAVVVNMDAAQLLQFRREAGIGSLLQNVSENPGILYTAIQDTSGILAASGNIEDLERIVDSPFLSESMSDTVLKTRVTDFQEEEAFEAVHPFYFEGENIGLIRIGISLAPLKAINSRIYRRITIISILLLVIGFFLFAFIMLQQNLDFTRRQYQAVETYSRNIIQNVSDAIIVHSQSRQVKIFNKSAEELFGIKAEDVAGKYLKNIPVQLDWNALLQYEGGMQELRTTIHGKARYLLVSKSQYRDEGGEQTDVLVFRDLTEQKRLENQIQRRERLSALGQLASGVAHEIRNPLNAIGTVVQQLNTDFEPAANTDEYHQLAGMVYREVRRINRSIENFLKFARPEPLHTGKFQISSFFEELEKQYVPLLEKHNMTLHIDLQWRGEVSWDWEKMKQVFGNLVQNAIDASEEEGRIDAVVRQVSENILEITVADNGPGMPSEILKKIFNLYFTTRSNGTGVGLSVVQQMVDLHNGVISVESEPGKGTQFLIRLPVHVQNHSDNGGRKSS